jgi:hypothetical protein
MTVTEAKMGEKQDLLRHFLAALAYRTQKALRGARRGFASFQAGNQVRTPHQIVCHMNSVLGYATTLFVGGSYRAAILPELADEVARLHRTLAELARRVAAETEWRRVTPEQLLHGPLADAMTHAGQLAMLRRLAGDPIPPENFVFADIDASNVGPDQSPPASPDAEWPERP